MKFTNTLILLFATATATALATPLQDVSADENAIYHILEKRRSCSGNRLNYEVCQGNLIAKMNSRHNWYVFLLLYIFLWSISLSLCHTQKSFQPAQRQRNEREKERKTGEQLADKETKQVSAQTAAVVPETVIGITASRSRMGRSTVRIAGIALRDRVKLRSIELWGWMDE